MEKHLNVTEIFYSLQGESAYSGYPCIFIRLSECNLRCVYCDTQYAFGKGKSMAISSIMEEVKKYPCSLTEITGGEPLLQEDVDALFEELHKSSYKILLETNGAISLEKVPDYVIKIVDVKTPGSGMVDAFLKDNLDYLNDKDELKFVLTDKNDYQFALSFLAQYKPKVNIIHFSPLTEVLEPKELAKWMLKDGIKAKLTLQLHKIIGIE
ncbi:7-carboxy-7-deazaguanine synthase QueE [Candidatus Cloacimonas acidaminovorans]|jgi:7-carboxy-7-deazaguanine synthase|uniref:7-carboxy-7-deazaguanine synthase n=1 Tax=Cloacimonas acidaminovorans (strain Evry) TaxID=459349 RepID=B0VFJ6_CLOAI|nr:radical SAM protein [Candidatus Cloacimonas acidaminovorans]CAO81334.1 Radical SAM [Candidatus Cloacimonas acidaminovorans str. Evry]